jgi:hypothetical protein
MFGLAGNKDRRGTMSDNERIRRAERDRYMTIGIAIGMPVFALVGFIVCIATDNPGLIGVGPAIGLAMGIAIGEGLYQRRRQNEADER